MEQQLLTEAVGFILTGGIGTFLGYRLQSRAWAHQHEVQGHDDEGRDARATYEQISVLLGRRLYRMRRLYWAAADIGAGIGDQEDLASARTGYREVLTEWNDNLYRILVLAGICFGAPVQQKLRDQVQENFAAAHRGLDEIVKMVAARDGKRTFPASNTGWTGWATRSISSIPRCCACSRTAASGDPLRRNPLSAPLPRLPRPRT